VGLNPSNWESGLSASPSRPIAREGPPELRLAYEQAANVARRHDSTCMRAQNDSRTALSRQSRTDPVEGTRPDRRARQVNGQEVNRVP
jgi:hypothetical protein